MSLSPRSPAYLALLGAFTALGPVATDMYLVSMPDMARDFQTSATAMQATLSVYFAGLAIGNILHGPLGDRYGRRPVMLGGLALFTVATVVCVLAETIETLLIARFFQALGVQAAVVLARAAVRDVYTPAQAPVVMSYLGMITGLAPVFAPIVGGVLHVAFGWPSVFYAMGAYGLMAALLLVVLFEETLHPDHRQSIRPAGILKNAAHILSSRAYLGFLGVLTFSFSGLFSYLSSAPFVYQGIFGLSEAQFGLTFGILSVGILIGGFLNARLTGSLGSDRMLKIGSWILLAAGGAMAVLALAGVDHLLAVAVPQFVFIIGCGILFPQSFASALVPFPHMAGTASSLLGFFQLGVAGLVGAVVAQFLKVDPVPGDQIPMAVALAVCALAVWGVLVWSAEARKKQASAAI